MALRSLYSGGSTPTIKASDELDSMLVAPSKSSGSDSLRLMKEILQLQRYQQAQDYRNYMMQRRMWLDQQKLQQQALGKTDKERKENMARLQLETAARAAVDDPEYIKRFGSLFNMSSTGRLKGLDALRDEYIKPLADKYRVSANELNKMLTSQTRAEFQKYREDIQKEAGYFANMGENLAASWRRLKDLPAELVSSPEERRQMVQEREAAAARDRAANRVLQDQYLRQQEGEGIWDRSEGLTGFLSNTLGAVPEMAPYMAAAALSTNPFTAPIGLGLAAATGAAQGSQMFTENVMASDVDEATKQQALASGSPERLANMAIGAGLGVLPVKGGNIARAGARGVQRLTGRGALGQELRAATTDAERKAALEAARMRPLLEASKRTLPERMAYGAAEDALTFGTMNVGQQMAMNALTNSALGTNTPWLQGTGEAFAMGAVPGAAFGMAHGLRPARRPVGPGGTPYLESGRLAKPLTEYSAELAAARGSAAERGADFAPVDIINRMRDEGYSYEQMQRAVEGLGLPETDMARLKDIYEKKYHPPVEPVAEEGEAIPATTKTQGNLSEFQQAYVNAAAKASRIGDIDSLVKSITDSTADTAAKQQAVRELLALAESSEKNRLSKNQKDTLRWLLESRHLADTIADGEGLHKVLDAMAALPVAKDPNYVVRHNNLVQALRDFVGNGAMQQHERQAVLQLLKDSLPASQQFFKNTLDGETGIVADKTALNTAREALQKAVNDYKGALREGRQETPANEQAASERPASEQQSEGKPQQPETVAEGTADVRPADNSGRAPVEPAAAAEPAAEGGVAADGGRKTVTRRRAGRTKTSQLGEVQETSPTPAEQGIGTPAAGLQPAERAATGSPETARSAGEPAGEGSRPEGDVQHAENAGGEQPPLVDSVDYGKVTQDALAAEKPSAKGEKAVPKTAVDNVKQASSVSPDAASAALAPLFENGYMKAMGLGTTKTSLNTLPELRAALAVEALGSSNFKNQIIGDELKKYHKLFGKENFMTEGWLKENIDPALFVQLRYKAQHNQNIDYATWHGKLKEAIDLALNTSSEEAASDPTAINCGG